MTTVNPNEAPDGYEAVDSKDVHGCNFCDLCPLTNTDKSTWCHKSNCMAPDRKDGCEVYFVKKEQPK